MNSSVDDVQDTIEFNLELQIFIILKDNKLQIFLFFYFKWADMTTKYMYEVDPFSGKPNYTNNCSCKHTAYIQCLGSSA